jgi:hypothetical protein
MLSGEKVGHEIELVEYVMLGIINVANNYVLTTPLSLFTLAICAKKFERLFII